MSVVYFLVLVGVLVAVHELGHFSAAKLLGVKVLRFSIGFGPAIVRWTIGETEFQIGLVPLGGFVKLLGEDPSDEVAEPERSRSFSHQRLWKRAAVVLAGPAANLILPIVIYFVLYARTTEVGAPVIGDLLPGGPAQLAGLKAGDKVVAADGKPVASWEDLEGALDAHAGAEVALDVIAPGAEPRPIKVSPTRRTVRRRTGERRERGLIGVTQGPIPAAIGVIDVRSAAGRAGLATHDVIVAVDGSPVRSWSDATKALAGRGRRLPVTVLRPSGAGLGVVGLRLYQPVLIDLVPDTGVGPATAAAAGIQPASLFVRAVVPGTPAAAAGIAPGDQLTHLDGRPITTWVELDQLLQEADTRDVRLTWLRTGAGGPERHEATIAQEERTFVDEFDHPVHQLVFGASGDFRVGPGPLVRTPSRVGYAASHAFARTGQTLAAMARGLKAITFGETRGDGVGGPVAVYRIASVSAAQGWDAYLLMVALISINLGLLNLLPIPGLDGGQLVLLGLEAGLRRPLTERVREAALGLGILVIVAITVLALRNDVIRYVLPR